MKLVMHLIRNDFGKDRMLESEHICRNDKTGTKNNDKCRTFFNDLFHNR